MTTATFTHHDHARPHIAPISRDLLEAGVAAVAVVLLLPGAALLMSFLTA